MTTSLPSPLDSYFTPYTPEAAKADEAMADRGASGIRHIQLSKLAPGSYAFRFLPPKPGQKSPFVIRYTHFIKGGPKIRAVPCVNRMHGRACLVCEEIARLDATGQAADIAVAADMKPEFSVQAVVLDCDIPFDAQMPQAQVAVLEFKKTVHQDLLGIRNNPRTGGEFTHPVTGFPIEVAKSGSGMGTEYKVTSMTGQRGALAPSDDAMIAIMQGAPDVHAMKAASDEDIAGALAAAGLGTDMPPAPPSRGGASSYIDRNLDKGGSARSARS